MILLSPTSCLRQPRPQSHAASLNQRAAYHTVRNDVKLADVDLVVFSSCMVIDEAQCSLRARGGFSDAARILVLTLICCDCSPWLLAPTVDAARSPGA